MPAEETLVLALVAGIAIDSCAVGLGRRPRYALRATIDSSVGLARTTAAAT